MRNHKRIEALGETETPSPSGSLGGASASALAVVQDAQVRGRGFAQMADAPDSASITPVRRATGPRTPQGKERSKKNATKHGIFSTAVLLPRESRAEFDLLHAGLWEALQPEGKLEEVLVEKLAAVLWRHRRLLLTEAAEIRKSVEFMAWDQQNAQQEKAEEIGRDAHDLEYKGGLIKDIRNPDVLSRCLELLAELREGVERKGFKGDDSEILGKIYGESHHEHLGTNVYDWYLVWSNTASVSEAERVSQGYASADKCKQKVLEGIDEELRRLKRYQKIQGAIEADRMKLEALRRCVPESPSLDRLLRYEASLERGFDRTLSQLERLQRIRRGQPVPPTVKLELSQ